MNALAELAGRVEALAGPDREVDALIRCAVFADPDAYVEQSPFNGAWCIYEPGINGKKRSWEPRGLSHLQRLGEFTASIDAAMTLVPEGWQGDRLSWWQGELSHCELIATRLLSDRWTHTGRDGRVEARAATLPLALCAAALRARSQEPRDDR